MSNLIDSAISILESEHTFKNDLSLASLYLAEERFEEAQELLNTMDYTDVDFNNWKALFQIQLDLAADSLTLFDMDSTSYAFVEELASSGVCELSNIQAQAILTMIKGIEYEPCESEEGSKSSGHAINTSEDETTIVIPETKTNQLKAFPNPFSESTIISYSISEKSEKAHLYLYNSLGKMILIFPIVNKKGIVQIRKKQLNPGIYLLSLVTTENKTNLKIIVK